MLHRVEVIKLKGHARGSAAFKEIMILDFIYGVTLSKTIALPPRHLIR
jgi:hypothetical protein